MSDEQAAVRFSIRYEPAYGYKVSIPNYDGGEVVDAASYDALRAENERLRAENASLREANEIDLGEKAPLIFENTELRAKVSELTRLLGEAEEAIREAADETGGEPEFSDERCGYETIQVSHGWRKEWRESAPVQRALKGASS